MRRLPADPRARARRKQDLLLASGLAREQAAGAIDELGQRADKVARGLIRLRAWASDPQVWIVAGAAGSVLALTALPRVRSFRWLRWGVLGWRLWRIGARLAVRQRAGA
jgi:hypothetical protein